MSATRTVTARRETRIRHVAQPLGRGREVGPHLEDLRIFVEACEEIPGDTLVRINKGQLDEGGRYDVTFELVHIVPISDDDQDGQAAS
jgi:hypothetical protein